MVTNEHIQSTLARAISDIEYLRNLNTVKNNVSPDLESGLTGAVDNVIKFSAFISKVQNNFLWIHFPLTFKLLHLFQIEIKLFSEYLPVHQQLKRDGIKDFIVKTERFVLFLKEYLEKKKDKKHKAIFYTLIHEETIWKLKQQHLPSTVSSLTRGKNSTIQIKGNFHINRFPGSPEKIVDNVLNGNTDIFPRKKTDYVYWLDSSTNIVSILIISKEVSLVLKTIDKHIQLKKLETLMKGRVSGKTLTEVLIFLLKNQLISVNQ